MVDHTFFEILPPLASLGRKLEAGIGHHDMLFRFFLRRFGSGALIEELQRIGKEFSRTS